MKGTPAVFIGGRRLDPGRGYSVELFQTVLDAVLAGKEP